MNKKKIAKRVTTLFMSLAVAVGCLGFIPSNGSEVNAAEVETINVYISSQVSNGFLHTPGYYSVSGNLAESYDYQDDVDNGVSALDVLVKAHELTYEDDFTAETKDNFLVINGGSPTTAFGVSEYYSGFAVGGQGAHDGKEGDYGYGAYTVNQAEVKNGQLCEFFFYGDYPWEDQYAHFKLSGKRVNKINAKAGAEIDLEIKGYSFMYEGFSPNISETPLADVNLSWVSDTGAVTGEILDTTDSEGKVSIEVPANAGSGDIYRVAAYRNSGTPVIMPLLTIYVDENVQAPDGTFVGGPDESGKDSLTLPEIKAVSGEEVAVAEKETADNVLKNYAGNPEYENEWQVMALARMGAAVPDGYYDKYYNNIVAKLKENNGGFDDRTYPTDYARVILALTAIGRDVTDVGGYNLVEKMKTANENIPQGNNAVVYTLIALNAVENNKNVKEDSYKEELLEKLLEQQNSNGGFGWSADYNTSGVDITAMAIQAMAPFYDSNDGAKQAIEKAKQFILANQSNAGGYGSAESAAQAVLALTAIETDPNATEALTAPERPYSIMDGLMRFYMGEGKFSYGTITGKENSYSTTQAFYALVDYQRFIDGKTSLYDMSDVEITYGSGDSGNNNGAADTQDKNNGTATDTGEDFPVGLMMTIMLLAILTAGGVCYEYRKKV